MARVAVVTGAGSGIGRAVTERLARSYRVVYALDANYEAVEEVANLDTSGRCVAWESDVTDPHSLRTIAATVERDHGRVDALVCCAGVAGAGTVVSVDLEHWNRVLDVNLNGVLHTLGAFVPLMIARSSGSVVVIGSTSAAVGFENSAPYAASKGAVTALARQAAIDLATHSIRVNVIAPGSVATPLVRRTFEQRGSIASRADNDFDQVQRQIAELHPLGRVGQPDEIAALVDYLTGSESSWMTGSVLTLDGGLTAR